VATVLSDQLIKPASDRRHYRLIELPNEMRVLLISDPEMEDDAAAEAGGQSGAARAKLGDGSPMDAEEDGEDGSEEDDDEDGEEDGEESEGEEESEEDDEEGEEGKGGAPVGKKAACAISVGVGYLCDPLEAGPKKVPNAPQLPQPPQSTGYATPQFYRPAAAAGI